LKKGTRLSKFEKKCDEGFLLGYSTTSKAYRVWNLASGILEEVHDVKFDKTNSFQEKNKNLDDVRGTQLANTMKKMDISDIRPKNMIEVEEDKDQVQVSGSHDQNQASSSSQVQDQQQVASTSSQLNDQSNSSNQVQVFQPSNVARDHPLDSIIGDISRGV
jgi:hypothetical protein